MQEYKVVEMYIDGISAPKIASHFGSTTGIIYRILKKNNINRKQKSMLQASKSAIIEKYLTGESIKSISEEFNCCWYTVRNLLKNNKIPLRTPKQYSKKYNLNESFFSSIDTQSRAYSLGFILADGCLLSGNNKKKSHSVSIEIQERDDSILHYINRSMNHTRPLYLRKSRNGWQATKTLKIINDKIFNDLKLIGLGPQKSFMCKYPKISSFLDKDLIRGIFDGDGCVFFKTHSNGSVQIINSPDVCFNIHKILLNNGIQSSLVNIDCCSRQLQRNIIGKMSEIKKFYNFIYDGAEFCLKRKRDVFLKFGEL